LCRAIFRRGKKKERERKKSCRRNKHKKFILKRIFFMARNVRLTIAAALLAVTYAITFDDIPGRGIRVRGGIDFGIFSRNRSTASKQAQQQCAHGERTSADGTCIRGSDGDSSRRSSFEKREEEKEDHSGWFYEYDFIIPQWCLGAFPFVLLLLVNYSAMAILKPTAVDPEDFQKRRADALAAMGR
jgi:hypothetical protein